MNTTETNTETNTKAIESLQQERASLLTHSFMEYSYCGINYYEWQFALKSVKKISF
jgi:hypothetical protein